MSGDSMNSTTEVKARRSASQFALEEIVRPLAIAGMMTCIAASVALFVLTIAPAWPADFIIILTFIVSLESIHAQRLLNRIDAGQRDTIRFRFVEWVVILLVVRFGVYLKYGGQRLLQDMASWSLEITTFISAEFVMNSLFILVFWAVALYLSKTVQELESTPFEKKPVVTDPDFYLRVTIPQHGLVDRRARIQGIVTTFFIGGALMIALAGLSQMDIRNVTLVAKPSTPVIFNIMLYYLIGLLLISQVHYTSLKANWENQEINIAQHLGRRWLLYVVIFLLIVGLISALLPVNYSVGIVSVISTVVRWIAYAFLRLIYYIIAGVTYLFMFIASLFKNKPVSEIVQPTPIPTPIPPETTGGVVAQPATWVQFVRSLLFWGVLVAVSAYAILRFLNDRLDLFKHLAHLRIFKWILALFGILGTGSVRLWQNLRKNLQRQVVALRAAVRPRVRMRSVNWKTMNTRERVQFLYLALLEYAAEQGLARPQTATPLEFEPNLAENLAEGGESAHHLTTSFVLARYSEHVIDDGLVLAAQQDWRTARRALNERKRRLAQYKAESQNGQTQG